MFSGLWNTPLRGPSRAYSKVFFFIELRELKSSGMWDFAAAVAVGFDLRAAKWALCRRPCLGVAYRGTLLAAMVGCLELPLLCAARSHCM